MMALNTQQGHKALALFYNCTSKCLLKKGPNCDHVTISSYSDQERQEILNWGEYFDITIPYMTLFYSTHTVVQPLILSG